MNEKNDKHFFNKIDNNEKKDLLTYLGNNPTIIKLWIKEKPEKVEEFSTTGLLANNNLCLEQSGNLLKKILKSSLANKIILLKFTIKQYNYFSTGHLSTAEDTLYHLLIDEDILKHEQRRDFRIEASNTHQIQFKIDDEVFECIDASAGGISFKAKIIHHERFKQDKYFMACKLKINTFQCDIPTCKVIKQFETIYTDDKDGKKYKYLAICIQFIELSPKQEETLAQYILSEARGLMVAKKFLNK